METLTRLFTVNVGNKLVSLLVAVVLWFVVLGSQENKIEKEVPLKIITKEGLVPANEIPEKVNFQLSGPKAFLRAILDRKEAPILVNLSNSEAGTVTYRFAADNISLFIGVNVLSINPSAIRIQLEKESTKTVPVHVNFQGVPPEGYEVTDTSVTPAKVKISGAKSRVKRVSKVFTSPIDLSEIREDSERSVTLNQSSYGYNIESVAPLVSIKVKAVSANFKIRPVKVRVNSELRHKLSDQSVTVHVRATKDQLANLDQSKVSAEIDLRGQKPGRYRRRVKVSVPSGIGIVKVIPERVRVTLLPPR